MTRRETRGAPFGVLPPGLLLRVRYRAAYSDRSHNGTLRRAVGKRRSAVRWESPNQTNHRWAGSSGPPMRPANADRLVIHDHRAGKTHHSLAATQPQDRSSMVHLSVAASPTVALLPSGHTLPREGSMEPPHHQEPSDEGRGSRAPEELSQLNRPHQKAAGQATARAVPAPQRGEIVPHVHPTLSLRGRTLD